MENKRTFDEEIDLLWLVQVLLKKIWLILIVALFSTCLTIGYTYLRIEPTYSSTMSMLVLARETTLTSLTDLQLGTQLTNDYAVLITSRPVLEEVIENLGLKMSYNALKKEITIVNPEDTRILTITATMNDAKQAKAVVDELSKVASEFIADKMEVTAPKIIEDGEIGTQEGPHVIKNAVIGFIVGAFLMCVGIVSLELVSDTIQREEDIEKYLGIPTLAVIPNKNHGELKKRSEGKKKFFQRKARVK